MNNITVDNEKFEFARREAIRFHGRFNIGTYNESTCHLTLKRYIESDTAFHEVVYKGHIADIKNSDGIYEIQSSSFGKLKTKLSVFLSEDKVNIVYPCVVKKRICSVDKETGEIKEGSFRRYPKAVYKIFPELLRINEFIENENLTVTLALISASEIRNAGEYNRRKTREVKADTVPEGLLDIISIKTKEDIKKLSGILPETEYSNESLSRLFGLKRRKLWMAIKLLEENGIIIGEKSGRATVYTLSE